LTGYTELPQWRKLIVAPSRLQAFMVEKIERETAFQKAGKGGKIIAKINGLLEPVMVQALYRASQAGVKIDIICRGICALRPGLPGISENIRVISIVDRFLEHSRIFYFENGGDPQIYVGSADWMDRNLSRRVEVIFPIEDRRLKERLIRDILFVSLSDNVKARELLPDGSYRRVQPADGQPRVRSQEKFLEMAGQAALRPVVELPPIIEITSGTAPATKPRQRKKQSSGQQHVLHQAHHRKAADFPKRRAAHEQSLIAIDDAGQAHTSCGTSINRTIEQSFGADAHAKTAGDGSPMGQRATYRVERPGF